MYLINHKIINFRNISDLLFTPERGVNVVYGQNGQGKTNLLESIYLLTGAKSFRARKDNEIIMYGKEKSIVNSLFYLEKREQTIKLIISDRGRSAERNKGGEKKASGLTGVFCCVLFSTESILLIKGGPQQRRNFIDFALCQISPKYLLELKKYYKILNQKNSLLKEINKIPDAYEILDIYDSQLVETARVVTTMRLSFSKSLLPLAESDYLTISGEKEKLNFFYHSTIWEEDEDLSFSQGLDKITKIREADIRAGFTTAGPHRDDLLITINDKDARIFSSQGQQRSTVIALKLAEASIIERAFGEKPLLLLDDILSELDSERQDYLLERLSDNQTIITGCDPALVSGRIDASIFEMKNGNILS